MCADLHWLVSEWLQVPYSTKTSLTFAHSAFGGQFLSNNITWYINVASVKLFPTSRLKSCVQQHQHFADRLWLPLMSDIYQTGSFNKTAFQIHFDQQFCIHVETSRALGLDTEHSRFQHACKTTGIGCKNWVYCQDKISLGCWGSVELCRKPSREQLVDTKTFISSTEYVM